MKDRLNRLKYHKISYYLYNKHQDQYTIIYGKVGSVFRILHFVKDSKSKYKRICRHTRDFQKFSYWVQIYREYI